MDEAIEALLREHIQKEDRILYPMALRSTHPAEPVRLADSYGVFDECEVIGAGEHGKLHASARELIASHPPEPGRIKPSATRIGCVENLSQ